MNAARIFVVLLAIGVAAVLVQQQRTDDSPPQPAEPIPVPVGGPYHGVALQLHSFGESVPHYERAIQEIAEIGADTVLLSAAASQENAGSTDLALDPQRGGTPQEWSRLVAAARAVGLRIVLMPIVLLDQPRGNEWRGVIQPKDRDWDAWFERYGRVIEHFARLAAEHEIEILIVGSELVSTEVYTDHWRRVIRAVRDLYPPPGKLAYSANWDHYRNIEFWNDLDLIGMTTYYKLSSRPGPSLESLLEAWRPIRNDILSWQRTVGKPIVFTEVGWCSQEGCSVEAWNYYRHDESSPAGLEEQRRCYEAFTRTWGDSEGLGGVIWWEWTPGPGGPTDHGYTPKGKPAQAVLDDWFASVRPRADDDERGATSQSARPASNGSPE